jgi:hypothetical protein
VFSSRMFAIATLNPADLVPQSVPPSRWITGVHVDAHGRALYVQMGLPCVARTDFGSVGRGFESLRAGHVRRIGILSPFALDRPALEGFTL